MDFSTPIPPQGLFSQPSDTDPIPLPLPTDDDNFNSDWQLVLLDADLPPPPPIVGRVSRKGFESGAYQFDSNGVILAYRSSVGWYYNPTTIANYALALYGAWYRGDASAYDPMLVQVGWLFNNAIIRQDNVGRNFRTYEYPFAHETFKAPVGWRSALASGHALMAIYIVGKVTNNQDYVDRSREFLLAYDVSVSKGGYRSTPLAGKQDLHTVWFEEVAHPQAPEAHILNGHIYAIFALDWYGKYAGNLQAARLAQDGLRGLQYMLHLYDIDGRSLYDLFTKFVNCKYHKGGHIPQLQELYKQTGILLFDVYAKRWAATPCP